MARLRPDNRLRCGLGLLVLCLVAAPVSAQTLQQLPQSAGDTGQTGAGEVGQRQEAEDSFINFNPGKRLNNRIRNRVENRVETRIDSKPDTEADPASSYEIAGFRSSKTLGNTVKTPKK